MVTLSGGKDSLYYLLGAIKERGKENVLAVHLARLSMEGVAHRELKAAEELAKLLEVNLKVIAPTNSTRIPGPRIMNFRDIFYGHARGRSPRIRCRKNLNGGIL